jgi:hypothetical protein
MVNFNLYIKGWHWKNITTAITDWRGMRSAFMF